MTSSISELIEEQRQRQRLENEISIAREVQSQLFPKDVPSTETLELKGVCHPARTVSGDYYDFMALPNQIAFAIGDVAGKGISAALLMATIQSTMRTQLGDVDGNTPQLSTARLVSNLNKMLFATTAPEKRGGAVRAWTAVGGAAAALGPVVGGPLVAATRLAASPGHRSGSGTGTGDDRPQRPGSHPPALISPGRSQ